jgi:hypothetical protein
LPNLKINFMPLKDALCNILKGTAEQVEEVGIEAALQKLHDDDKAKWTTVCDAINVLAGGIAIFVKSPFVEALLQGLETAVADSKAANP